jgi:hypothetical protein
MKRQTALYNAEMFARYVKPQIEDLFENEWENKWWPKFVLPESRLAIPRPLSLRPWQNAERPRLAVRDAS